MFARLVAEGRSQAEAYRRTYGRNGGTAEAGAARLMRRPDESRAALFGVWCEMIAPHP